MEIKERKEMSVSVGKPNLATAKAIERRKKVQKGISAGLKAWQMANMFNVSEKTIERDIEWIFSQTDYEAEVKELLERLRWSSQEVWTNYQNATDPHDKGFWLALYNNINRNYVTYLKRSDTQLIGIQNNTQINMGVIWELKKLQDESEKPKTSG